MKESTVVFPGPPAGFLDALTEVLRAGARQLLVQAVGAEVGAWLAAHEDLRLADGRRRVVRRGHAPERVIQTGIGAVPVRRPKVRDRGGAGKRLRFHSAILPRFARRAPSLDAALPTLYLLGVSSGDFREALSALLGPGAPGLSPPVIGRLTAAWEAEHERWRCRELSERRYVHVWAGGIYLQGRLEDEKQCVVVLLGATAEGRKELPGFQAGFRESAQSWRELLADLKGRGLAVSPELAIGDGALGFWKALDEVFPGARRQRCRVHKTPNVLNALPRARRRAAKRDLHQIRMAEGRAEAAKAMATFAAKYQVKYPKAVTCLTKDRDALLAFYDFPAEHWRHIRTTNPIESVFATVRHRTVRSKGCLSHRTALAMVFQRITAASKTWRRLNGHEKLTPVVRGVKFTDGVQADETETCAAA